ncbi:hypothetical protein BGZ60DRAFT_535039 [Tricladium varicosporioides]|nr:hypothetical protein BGZ60DRAFT_535039 [Hymenoscyphus varicosporioides]
MLLSIATLLSALFVAPFVSYATALPPEERDLASMPNDACLCQITHLVVAMSTSSSVETLPSLTATPNAPKPTVESLPSPTTKSNVQKPSVDDVEYMKPCPNPTINKLAPENMIPSRNIAVYYESPDSSSVAIVTYKNMRFPVVVLEYIDYIAMSKCTGSTFTISFTDTKSLQYASLSWQSVLSQGLVILSYCPTCGQDYPYQRAWLKINTIVVDEDTQTMSCTYTVVEIIEVVTIVDIAFGPKGGSSSSMTSSFSTMIAQNATSSILSSSSKASIPTNSASSVTYLALKPISTGSFTVNSVVSTRPSSSSQTSSTEGFINNTNISNSTSTPSETSTGSIPVNTVAPLESLLDFDVVLDDSLGNLDPSSPTFWSQLMPGVDSNSFFSRKIRRRGFSFGAIGSSLANAAKDAIANNPQAVINAVTDFIQNAQNNGFTTAVADATKATAQALANYLSSFTLGPFPFNFSPGQHTTTPFGDGVQLISRSNSAGIASGTISAYCVGCAVSGSVTVGGQFVIDIQQEALTTAIIEISGPVQAQLAFALVGKVAGQDSFQTNIFTYPIPPGLSIMKLITIGPYVSVDVGGSFDFSLQGGVELGGSLSWANLDAKVDLLSQTITPSGLSPTFTPVFDFEDSASLNTKLYGLVTIGAGIKILGGKYAADVGIVGKPEVDLQANQKIYSQFELSQLKNGDVVCGGVNIGVQQIDSAYIQVEYIVATKTKSKTWGLATTTPYTFSTCFGQLSTINQIGTSSAVPSSAVPSTASSAPLPQSSCGYLDGDEPDDDGDEDMTCVPISGNTQNTLPIPTATVSVISASSTASNNPTSTCDPSLNDIAFISCINSVFAAQRTAEASIFGGAVPIAPVGKRSLETKDLTPTPASHIVPHIPRQTESSVSVSSSVGVVSHDGSIFVSWADDGNMVVDLDSTRSAFQAIGGVAFADPHSRYLHLYKDTMAMMGISRLRLASLDAMPAPSVLVALTPLKLADGSSSYVATTTDGQLFYLITCLIAEQYPKVFLAKDPVVGATKLQDPALAMTLTGGNVTQCGFVNYGPGK